MLERQGCVTTPLDMLIAAHVLSLHRALLTNNEAEFARIRRLRVLNWARTKTDPAQRNLTKDQRRRAAQHRGL